MNSTSEHFQIVKNSQTEKKIPKKIYFNSSTSNSKENLLSSDKLLGLKQLIDQNKMEYTLTVCILLTFIKKGKDILTKDEIISSAKEEIANNPNRIFIFKGGSKEKVELKNLGKRVNILLFRSHYVNKIDGSKEQTKFSLNIKIIEDEFKNILNDVLSLSKIPVMKIKKNEKEESKSQPKAERNSIHKFNILNNQEMIEIKENENESEIKNDENIPKVKLRKRRMKNININFHKNGLQRKRLNDNADKEININNNTFINNKKNYINNKLDSNTNTNINSNINNNLNNNQTNNLNNNNINNSRNNNNITNKFSLTNKNEKSRSKPLFNNNIINTNDNKNISNNIINENEQNFDILINPLLNKGSKLINIIDDFKNNPQISKNIIENERKRIENEIKIIQEEINLKKKEINDKNKQLLLFENNQQLFNSYQTKNIRSLTSDIKLLCIEYQNRIKVAEHYKEIIKLTKNNDEKFLIEKYKQSCEQSRILYNKIFDKLSLIFNEYTSVETIIDNLYKDNINNINVNNSNFGNYIKTYKSNNSLNNIVIVENLKKFLKTKLERIDNDDVFNKFLNYENEKEKIKNKKNEIISNIQIENNNKETNKEKNDISTKENNIKQTNENINKPNTPKKESK